MELKTPAAASGSSGSGAGAATTNGGRSFSELVQSDAVTMQFMCVTQAQRKALPPEVKERITLHQVMNYLQSRVARWPMLYSERTCLENPERRGTYP